MKAVIDTNVWLSGLFWGGVPYEVLDLIYIGTVKPCFSRETYREWNAQVKKLAVIFGKLEYYIRDKKLIEKSSQFFVPREKITVCRDPKDNKFLEAAVASRADFLVSGDRDLVALKKYGNTYILAPAQFLKEV
ncbi:MAG: hypothetical protein UT63_C0053G0012 [Candidatus Gottesmanbacteria bacterium GW2011_GWC2_39_8]|uniref:PIN domain-containing protein n=1 Tax=Candidatus Gottesmanbacteria bacterium GW2011_GWC2_39_8 TaxID=1618450 RepID=A0A0G0Q3V6_9BACT|nr:MAG: hypothetical protein UT63_C0053G0012 [Candidatus Gottesmanbacteria bacterium GW2011_GWC2_39_8]